MLLTWEDVAFCVHSSELECCADLWRMMLSVSIVVNWSVVLTWEDVAFCVHSSELECCADLGG